MTAARPTIVVTGGAGFIGSVLVRRLLAADEAHVVTVDKLTYAANRSAVSEFGRHPRHRLVQADINDQAAMTAIFRDYAPAAVLHLAAESHVDRSIVGADEFLRTNVDGTFTLLETCRRFWSALDAKRAAAFRFIHVSTDEVYGTARSGERFSEASPYAPNSPYAASKAASDHLARAWRRTYGLPTIITHCSNNYGPRQFPEKLIPLAIQKAILRQPIPVYGNGSNVRDWIHVEDHVDALLSILRSGQPGETYCIGAEAERTNLELVQALCAAIDLEVPAGAPHAELIRFVADRPGHDRRYAIDPTKIRHELHWRPRRTLGEGLRQTVRWYLSNGDWLEDIRRSRYAGERIGASCGSKPSANHLRSGDHDIGRVLA
jgi:dTDP-glucose 4,6-dehydratase